MTARTRLSLLLVLFGLTAPAGLLGQTTRTFIVNDPFGRNTVVFKTEAPLEDIVGTTHEITGSIEVDLSNPMDVRTRVRFEVNMASLDTGLNARNEDLSQNYLHTGRYPKGVFTLREITRTSAPDLLSDANVRLRVAGTFELHGVVRETEVSLVVRYIPETPLTRFKLPGNLLRVSGRFDIKLSDYNIEVPSMLLLRVGDTAHITIDFFASDASEAEMSQWEAQLPSGMASPAPGEGH